MPFRRILAILFVPLLLCAGLNPGLQTCPSSGNKAVIASASSCPQSSCKANTWTIQAPTTNTGKVYIGGSTVTTSTGVAIAAGDSASMYTQSNTFPYDLTQTYIACTASGDSVTFNYNQ